MNKKYKAWRYYICTETGSTTIVLTSSEQNTCLEQYTLLYWSGLGVMKIESWLLRSEFNKPTTEEWTFKIKK